MNKLKCFSVVALAFAINLFSLSAVADGADAKTLKVCRNMMDILRPKGVKTSDCYDQAKAFLKEKGVQVMAGSYEAYFALSEKVPAQKVCRAFLKDVVTASQKLGLDDAQALFENDKAQSLDKAFYSYQTCDDLKNAALKNTTDGSKSQSKAVQ